jgi:hypothetical protein
MVFSGQTGMGWGGQTETKKYGQTEMGLGGQTETELDVKQNVFSIQFIFLVTILDGLLETVAAF